MAKPCLIEPNDEIEQPPLQWFAVCTLPRHEKRVAERVGERQLECFLPSYHQERQWKKRPLVVVDVPLFPTYLFVRIRHIDRASVLGISGVLSILGNGRQGQTVSNAEIEALRVGMELHSIEPHPYLEVGESVRVKRGALAGYKGLLIRRKNMFRVVLSVELIRQSISVEIDTNDLELLTRT